MAEYPGDRHLVLLVEGTTDRKIAREILSAAKLPIDNIEIITLHGKERIRDYVQYVSSRLASELEQDRNVSFAALVDLDEPSVADAHIVARKQLGYPKIPVFCAVPQIENWALADPELLDRVLSANNRKNRQTLASYAKMMPEDIRDPKSFFRYLFGSHYGNWSFLRGMDIDHACSRSPSLRVFISGIEEIFGIKRENLVSRVAKSVNLELFSGLINEVVPSDVIVWRTLNGEKLSAAQLITEIENGTELGLMYASEVLRIVRDFLMRESSIED